MKKIIGLMAACLFTAGAIAQDIKENKKIKGENYCALVKDDGMVVVVIGGKEITADVTLENKAVIKPNGIVIKRDGTQMILKNGDCVDTLGNTMKSESDKMGKVKDKMSPDAK